MTNEFKRTPTHGENDVDLRVATEPRRVTDAVLSQIIATKDGEIAALTAEVTHLAEKLAERDAGVDRNSVKVAFEKWASATWSYNLKPANPDSLDTYMEGETETAWMAWAASAMARAAPQPVDAAQAVPGVKQLTAQLHDGQTWTVAEQRAFAQVLAAFPNESSQGIISLGDAWKHGQAYGEATVSKATRATCAEASQKLRTYIGIYTGDKQARRLADQLANIATSIAQPTDTTKGA